MQTIYRLTELENIRHKVMWNGKGFWKTVAITITIIHEKYLWEWWEVATNKCCRAKKSHQKHVIPTIWKVIQRFVVDIVISVVQIFHSLQIAMRQ